MDLNSTLMITNPMTFTTLLTFTLSNASTIRILAYYRVQINFWVSTWMKTFPLIITFLSYPVNYPVLFSSLEGLKIFYPPTLSSPSTYYSLFHCHLSYCPNIFGTSSNSNISKIAQLQRKAIRIITSSPNRAHTPPLFHSLNILPFPELLKLHRSLFMHSVEYNYCLDSFVNVWPKNTVRALSQQLRNSNVWRACNLT
jgi:hypothetical protein